MTPAETIAATVRLTCHVCRGEGVLHNAGAAGRYFHGGSPPPCPCGSCSGTGTRTPDDRERTEIARAIEEAIAARRTRLQEANRRLEGIVNQLSARVKALRAVAVAADEYMNRVVKEMTTGVQGYVLMTALNDPTVIQLLDSGEDGPT